MANKTFTVNISTNNQTTVHDTKLCDVKKQAYRVRRREGCCWRKNASDEQRRADVLARFSGSYIASAQNLSKLFRITKDRRARRLLKTDIAYFNNTRLRLEAEKVIEIENGSNSTKTKQPVAIMDIGEQRISELIHEIVGTNEDAYQDAWCSILAGECATDEDIKEVAREAKKANQPIYKFKEISLQKPLSFETDKPRTLEDIIKSPELILDEPEPKEQRRKKDGRAYLYRQGMDEDVADLLRRKYPGESLRHALRMALGLPTKDTHYWKSAELSFLRDKYPTTSIQSIATWLGRTNSAVQNKAQELGLRRNGHSRITPSGSFNREDLLKIFHFSAKQLNYLILHGYLPWQRYKNITIFHRSDIIAFIRNHPFLYRHDLLSAGWRYYIPIETLKWLTIEQVAQTLHWSHYKIRRMIRDGELPNKFYGNGHKSVAYLQLESAVNYLKIETIPQPYPIARLWEKTHYAFWNDDHDLVRACQPNIYALSNELIKAGHKPPFLKGGFPTCLKCLKILEKYRATKCK